MDLIKSFGEAILYLLPNLQTPQPLEWIFLVILSIIYYRGYQAYKAYEQKMNDPDWLDQHLQEESESVRGLTSTYRKTMNAYSVFSVSELMQYVKPKEEYIISRTPGSLVLVGLVGTFYGIGLSVSGLSDFLAGEMSSQIDQMKETLNLIGLQFKSSIWGITASIIYRRHANTSSITRQKLLNSVSKISGAQESWFQQLVDPINQVVLEIGSLEKASERMSRVTADLSKKLGEEIQRFTLSSTSFSETTVTFGRDVKTVMKTVDNSIREANKNLLNSVKDLNKAVNDSFAQLNTGVSSTLITVQNSMVGASDRLQSEIQNLSQRVNDQLKAVEGASKELSQKVGYIDTTLSKIEFYYKESLAQREEQLQAAVAFKKAAVDANEKVAELGIRLESVLNPEDGELLKAFKDANESLVSTLIEELDVKESVHTLIESLAGYKTIVREILEQAKGLSKIVEELEQANVFLGEIQEQSDNGHSDNPEQP